MLCVKFGCDCPTDLRVVDKNLKVYRLIFKQIIRKASVFYVKAKM